MMWNRYGMAITAISLGLTASLVSYDAVHAARIRNYTPREARAVLNGFGYTVTVSDAPLTDAATINAIREFQRGYKLTVDGIAGPQTQDLMAELMMILQANLNLVVKPTPPLPRTQFYGSATEAVVRQYQQKVGLPVTGIATLPVRKQLDDEATLLLNNQSTPTPAPTPRATPPAVRPTLSPPAATPPTVRPTLSPPATTPPTVRPTLSPPATTPQPTPPAVRPTVIPLPTPIPQTSPLPTPQTIPSPTPLPSPGGVLPAPATTP